MAGEEKILLLLLQSWSLHFGILRTIKHQV